RRRDRVGSPPAHPADGHRGRHADRRGGDRAARGGHQGPHTPAAGRLDDQAGRRSGQGEGAGRRDGGRRCRRGRGPGRRSRGPGGLRSFRRQDGLTGRGTRRGGAPGDEPGAPPSPDPARAPGTRAASGAVGRLGQNGRVLQQLFSPSVLHALDLIGIFAFAISGALLAVRKNFDVFGLAVLAEVTGLGGGLFRDLVIGAVPPAAFTDLGYFVTPLIATVLVFFFHPHVERLQRGVNVFDAAGLGLFCVVGTVKAHDYGLNLAASAALGLMTAVGGGVL